MQRRKFLATVGSLAAGSAAAIGTGAFSQATVDRKIEYSIATDDSSGFLALEAASGPNAQEFVTESAKGNLKIAINETEIGGDGVNEHSTFLFDNLFTITNLGTQPVWVWANSDYGTPYVMDAEGNTDPTEDAGTRRSITPGSADQSPYELGDRGMVFHFYVGETKTIGLKLGSDYNTGANRKGMIDIKAAADEEDVPTSGGFELQPNP